MSDRSSNITFKIGSPIMKAPFKYISNYQHTDVGADIFEWKLWSDDSGIDCTLQIMFNRQNRIRTFRTNAWIQCLVFWCIIIRYEFNAQLPAIFCVV